jgi:DNA repair exonuclease SbcCD ATPase subunit
MNAASAKFTKETGAIEKKLKAIQELERGAQGSLSKHLIQQFKDEREQLVTLKESIQKEYQKKTGMLFNELLRSMSSMSKETTRGLAQTGTVQLQAVKSVSKDIVGQFKIVKNAMEEQSNMSKILSFSDHYKKMEQQGKEFTKSLKSQMKSTKESEDALNTARYAMWSATNLKIKQENTQMFMETFKHHKITKENYMALEKEVDNYRKSLQGVKNETKQLAAGMKIDIGDNLKVFDLRPLFKNMFKSIENYAESAGTATAEELVQSARQSGKLEKGLNDVVNRLKQMKIDAEALQKTGLVDVSDELTKIKSVMDYYSSRIKEYKQERDQLFKTFGNRRFGRLEKDNQAEMSSYNDLKRTYAGLIKEGEEFRRINKENFTEALANVRKTQQAHDLILESRKKLNNRIRAIEDEMQRVEVAMQKSTNQKVIKAYEERHNRLKAQIKDINALMSEKLPDKSGMEDRLRRITKLVEFLHDRVKRKIDFSNIETQFKRMTKNLENYAEMAGNATGEKLYDNMMEGRQLAKSLEGAIARLKEMKANAELLKQTGLVDTSKEIAKINKILSAYQTMMGKYKAEQKQVYSVLGNQKFKGTQDFGLVDFQKLYDNFNKLINVSKQFGKIDENNFMEAFQNVKNLEKLHSQYVAKRKQLLNTLKELDAEKNRLELAAQKSTSEKIVAEFEKRRDRIKKYMEQVRKELGKTANINHIKDQLKEIEKAAEKLQRNLSKNYRLDLMYPEAEFNKIKGYYEKIQMEADKLSKKNFISTKSMDKVKAEMNHLQDMMQKYEEKIRNVRIAWKNLEDLQRKGLGNEGIQKQINDLQKLEAKMRSYTQKLNSMATTTHNNLNRLHTTTVGSLFRTGLDFFRNLRWQVATFVYLISKAVMGIKRVFFSVLDEAQEFRKNAMSIAASVAYQLTGTIQENYEKAYQFSRGLMNKLEMEAARTILTLEDLMMMTKTFVQAGIIPETDEDVRKISVIGTAIKALTEGMANQGVQMRQELNAVILGRQRATDQLSMMFKLMGVDIKKATEQAKREGKELYDVLAKLLEPFDQMNTMMEKEFATAVNTLKTIWGIIKRIAAETVLLDIAKEFNEFIDKYFDRKTKKLTRMGEEAVVAVRAALNTLYMFGKNTIEVFLSAGRVLRDIMHHLTTAIHEIGFLIGLWEKNASGLTRNMELIVNSTKIVLYTLFVIERTVASISYVFQEILSYNRKWRDITKEIARLIYAIGTGNFDDLKEALGGIKKELTEAENPWRKLRNFLDDGEERIKRVDESIQKLTKDLNLMGESVELNRFKWAVNPSLIAVDMEKINGKIRELEASSESGLEKIKKEHENRVALYEQSRKDALANLQQWHGLQKRLKEGDSETKNYSPEFLERLKAEADGFQDVLSRIETLKSLSEKRMQKETNEYWTQYNKKMAEQLDRANSFYTELVEVPLTPVEKVEKWASLMEEEIKKLIVTNKFVAAESEKYWEALEKGTTQRMANAIKEMENEYNGFVETMTSHKKGLLTPFEEINNEFDKIKISILESKNLTEEKRMELLRLIPVLKEERMLLAAITQQQRNQAKSIDLLSAKSSYKQQSFNPLLANEGEIEQIKLSYVKAYMDIQNSIEETKRASMDMNGKWKKGTELNQEYIRMLNDEIRQLGIAVHRDLWKKTHPLWNDLTEMSKNWADGLSDTLTTLIMDFDNFGDSVKALQEQIVSDFLKASIKRGLVDPFMGFLGGGGEKGDSGALKDLFGGIFSWMGGEEGKKSPVDELFESVMSGKPLPVTIVGGGFDNNIIKEMAGNNGFSNYQWDMYTPQPVDIVNGVDGLESSMDENKNMTRSVAIATKESSRSISSGMASLARSIASSLLGIGGSGGSNLWGAIADVGMAAYSAYSSGGASTGSGGNAGQSTTPVGMAKGGVITEHIVGQGLSSGKTYNFGEGGESEYVIPKSKIDKLNNKGGSVVTVSMPVNISAIDTKTGAEFLASNQGVIEAGLVKALKNNRKIRAMMRNAR